MATEIPQDVPQVDFYFTCPSLKCTMKASACEKNRTMPAKSQSLILTKQSGSCRSCDKYAEHQQSTAISIADFHAGISISDVNNSVESVNFRSNLYSTWTRGSNGRTRVG